MWTFKFWDYSYIHIFGIIMASFMRTSPKSNLFHAARKRIRCERSRMDVFNGLSDVTTTAMLTKLLTSVDVALGCVNHPLHPPTPTTVTHTIHPRSLVISLFLTLLFSIYTYCSFQDLALLQYF